MTNMRFYTRIAFNTGTANMYFFTNMGVQYEVQYEVQYDVTEISHATHIGDKCQAIYNTETKNENY